MRTDDEHARDALDAAPPAATLDEAMATADHARANILVVDDEPTISEVLCRYLQRAGYGTRVAADGHAAMAAVLERAPDLIVLDLMLPGIDGLEVMRRVREHDRDHTAIILLTARGEESDRIVGLRLGADDYVVKPFSPAELVARVDAVLRRVDPAPDKAPPIEHGDVVIDAGRREVKVGDQEVQLAPKEFDLLWELLDHRGLVLTRDQLLERVWGYTFAGDTRTVDVHVRQLRRKLGDASPIVTVWGVGYKVATEPKAAAAT